MNRRGFLGAMLAAATAPAIVKAASLMPIAAPKDLGPLVLWGDGLHDDTKALQAFMNGQDVYTFRDGVLVPTGAIAFGQIFKMSDAIVISDGQHARSMMNCAVEWVRPVRAGFILEPSAGMKGIDSCSFNFPKVGARDRVGPLFTKRAAEPTDHRPARAGKKR